MITMYRNLDPNQKKTFQDLNAARTWIKANADACDGLTFGDIASVDDCHPDMFILTRVEEDEGEASWEVEHPDEMYPVSEDWDTAVDLFLTWVEEAILTNRYA